MNDSQQFPFALEANAVDKWLANINLSDPIQLSNELHQIVKNLNHSDINKDLLFEIINKFSPVVASLSNELEQKFFSESHPLDTKTHKLGRLNLHLIRGLATAYHKITTGTSTSKKRLLQCIHSALQLIGQHMLLSTKISEKPANFSWKISAKLYQTAKQEGLLLSPVTEKIQGSKTSTTIVNLLKRNLLFSICNPYPLACPEIDALFSFLAIHCHLTDLKEATPGTEDFCFVWEYSSATTPSPALQGKTYHSTVILNTTRLINYFKSSQIKPPFTAFGEVQLRLSSYQKIIQSDIPTMPKVCLLFSGFDQISESLQQQARKNKIREQSNITGISNALRHAKLEPLDHERTIISSNNGSTRHIYNATQKTNTVKILQTQDPGYIIIVSQPAKYDIDNLVIVVNDDKDPDLGIIRTVLNITQSNTQRVLIELITGDSHCSEVLDPKFSGPAILITKATKPAELILTPKSYNTGSNLHIDNSKLKLEKLTEVTPYFMRYQVTTIL
jgi:hypothetical protein